MVPTEEDALAPSGILFLIAGELSLQNILSSTLLQQEIGLHSDTHKNKKLNTLACSVFMADATGSIVYRRF